MYRIGKSGLKEIYVIGCGPSLKDFNWQLLKDKTTIAVNGSLIDVPNPDFFLTADSGFACKASQANFWNVETQKILVMGPGHTHFRSVKPYLHLWNHRITPVCFNGDIGFNENNFATGQSSGFCGMQLAVILGAKKIHLLGMDFTGKGKGNYHNRYTSNPKTWNEFLLYFNIGIRRLQQYGLEIVNHSSISLLNNTIPYEELT